MTLAFSRVLTVLESKLEPLKSLPFARIDNTGVGDSLLLVGEGEEAGGLLLLRLALLVAELLVVDLQVVELLAGLLQLRLVEVVEGLLLGVDVLE